MDLRKYLQLDDQIIDLKIIPNRGDCLSVNGVAREVAVLNHCGTLIPVNLKLSHRPLTTNFLSP